jgi:hypothetical protein
MQPGLGQPVDSATISDLKPIDDYQLTKTYRKKDRFAGWSPRRPVIDRLTAIASPAATCSRCSASTAPATDAPCGASGGP